MTTDDIRELLDAYPDVCTLEGAEELLKDVDSCIDMLWLYDHYFPDDFSRTRDQGTALLPDADATYSQCEEQFFALVDASLFPLALDWILDDIYDARSFAYYIPIAPFGLDFEGGYGDTPPGWLLVLYLLGSVNERLVRSFGGVLENDRLFEIPLVLEGQVSQSLLNLRCEAQAGPIANFPSALEMLHYDTGTVWLDMTMSEVDFSHFCWTTQDIDRLRRQYLRAQDIQEKAEAFCAWLEEEPLPRFAMVARLWKSCMRDTPLQQSQLPAIVGARGPEGYVWNP